MNKKLLVNMGGLWLVMFLAGASLFNLAAPTIESENQPLPVRAPLSVQAPVPSRVEVSTGPAPAGVPIVAQPAPQPQPLPVPPGTATVTQPQSRSFGLLSLLLFVSTFGLISGFLVRLKFSHADERHLSSQPILAEGVRS